MDKKIIAGIAVLILVPLACYYYGKIKYDDGYKTGYNAAYSKGYSDGYADKGKLVDNGTSTVKTETKVVYQKVPYTGNDVQITTPPPTVTVSVNGKKQQIQQKTETADLAVKTETAVKIRVPERRWVFGVGTDGKKPMYLLKAPISGAVGAWVAGGSHKFMGGVSISF